MAVESAIYAAYAVIEGAFEPDRTSYATVAAEAATRAAKRMVAALDDPMATAALQRDYEILLETFGEHETVVVGEPIDLSETLFLGEG